MGNVKLTVNGANSFLYFLDFNQLKAKETLLSFLKNKAKQSCNPIPKKNKSNLT